MEEKTQKEINFFVLLEMFFKWLGKAFIKILQLLGEGLRLLYKYKILTIIFFILSLVAGWFIGRPEARKYNVEGMIIINGASAQTVKDISKKLEWAGNSAPQVTSHYILSLPEEVTKSISRLQSFYVIDCLNDSTPDIIDFEYTYPPNDTINVRMTNRLYYRFKTTKPAYVPVFEEAFLKFFNTQPLLVKEFDTKKKTLEEKLEMTDREIKRLDSLANSLYLKEGGNRIAGNITGAAYFSDYQIPVLYKQQWEVYNYKLKFEEEYSAFTAPVVMPAGFNIFPKPILGWMKSFTITGLGGLSILILLCLFLENRKQIAKYLSKGSKH